ncbi:uncharacterized protein [Argopecten irradians]|uniref:uncharacterized protein n=1 Tax=Argopecten irradians TaxID=31199 RepID=UPI003713B6A7
MDRTHRDVLRKTRPILVQDLDVGTELQDLLVAEDVFTPQMLDLIQREEKRVDKVRKLLNALERRGPTAYDAFIKCLTDSGHGHLAIALEEKEKELRSPSGPTKTVCDEKPGRHPKLAAMIETTKCMLHKDKECYQFIKTRSLLDIQQKLLKNKIVIIQGNTGDGKSSIALELLRLLCLDQVQQNRCRQPLQLHDIKDLDLVAPKSQLVIFIDDIFGKNVVCPDEVREWEKRERSVDFTFCGDDKEANYMIITTRSGILNSIHSLEAPFIEQNIVDLSKYTDELEKLELLLSYEPKVGFVKWTDDEKNCIVKSAPDIGFPQCCRLFRDTPNLQTERVNFFRKPFQYLKSALSRLENWKFGGMLYLFLNGGRVIESSLDPSNDNIEESENMKAAFANDVIKVHPTHELGCKRGRKTELVKESLECLMGWLVKKDSIQKQGKRCPCYVFNHDSIEETVALLYGEKTPIGYIKNCPRKFLSYVTKATDKPNTIRMCSDDQTNAMYERTVTEFKCIDPVSDWYLCEWEYLVSLDVWSDPLFRHGFITWLDIQDVHKRLCPMVMHALLNGACSIGSECFALYLLSVGVTPDEVTPFCVVKGGSVKLLRELLKYDVTATRRALMSRSPHFTFGYFPYNINVLHEACLFEREEMVTMLCDTYPDLVLDNDGRGKSTLHHVARTGNCAIFKIVERKILTSLCRVEDDRCMCVSEDGCVVHRDCACGQYMSQLVDNIGRTILHVSCRRVNKELTLDLCESYPALTVRIDNDGWHCLHHIARHTADVDLFVKCEGHVKQYVEKTGGKFDVTSLRTNDRESVLDMANKWTELKKLDTNPLYDYIVKRFTE